MGTDQKGEGGMSVLLDSGKILVVDDEKDIRALLTEHLEEQGYTVMEAMNADEALHNIRVGRPDLVLLDISLPGMNGLEVLRRIRRDAADIGVIMISGNEDVGLARSTVQLGALDYLFKPFDLERLDRAVRSNLGLARGGPGAPALEISVDHRGDVAVLAPSGSLDARGADQIKQALARLMDRGTAKLVVDLDRVDYLDSSGLGALVSAMKRARTMSGDLRLCAPSENVRAILDMTGLIKHVAVHGDAGAAVASWS